MSGQGGAEYARRLGAEIRTRRLSYGMSLRALAKQLGLSGHGTLVDYEHGRRIPPEDLVVGCERVFQISDGALRNLREKALAERAGQQADLLLSRPEQPAAPAPVVARARPWWRRRSAVVAAVVLLAVGVGVGVWRLTASPPAGAAAKTPVVAAGRTVVAGWGECWGGGVGGIRSTNAVTYGGVDSLQITLTKPNEAGDFAVCTHHGLSSLHAGMKVTAYVWPAAPYSGSGLGFFVYDSHYNPTWAPETPKGDHVSLPGRTDWQKYVWTVPRVDKVITIGMEVYSTTSQPLIVWLGKVTW